MNTSPRYCLALLGICLLAASTAYGQATGTNAGPELNITLGEQHVRFAPTRSFQEMRLEVVNSVGEIVFTHTTTEAEFDWNLRAANSEVLAPGLYRYALTLKFSEDQTRQHTGHFIVEKGQDQIWLTASDGAEVSGTALNAARSGGRSIAGLTTSEDKSVKRDVSGRAIVDEKGNKLADASKAAKQEKAALLGTVNRVAKFGVGGVADTDSGIREDASGRLGFGVDSSASTPLLFNGDINGALGAGLPSLILQSNSDHARLEVRQAGAGAPIVQGRSSGGTLAAPTASPLNQFLGGFGGSGHDGAGYAAISHGFIGIRAGENWTPAAKGTYITFDATQNGGTTRTEKMRVTGNGNVGIGFTSPLFKLDVSGIINADGHYNLFSNRVLASPGSNNLFVGFSSGPVVTTGAANSFVGTEAGLSNTSGGQNTFVGWRSGKLNSSGSENTFVGVGAGEVNTIAAENTFIGRSAGIANTTGPGNTFIGFAAGSLATTGSGNTMLGHTADFKAAAATLAGCSGCDNTYVGNNTGGAATRSKATAIGAGAFVECDNCAVIGDSGARVGIGTASPVSRLDIQSDGSSTGDEVHLTQYNGAAIDEGPVLIGRGAMGTKATPTATQSGNTLLLLGATGYTGTAFPGSSSRVQFLASENWSSTARGSSIDFHTTENGTTTRTLKMRLDHNGNVGIGTSAPTTSRLEIVSSGAATGLLHLRNINERAVIGLQSTIGGIGQTWTIENGVFGTQGLFAVYNSTSGATALSIQPSNNVGIGTDTPAHKLHVNGQVAGVGAFLNLSDARYKKNIQPLQNALNKVLKLRGVSYEWRQNEYSDLQFGSGSQVGFIAQELETVLPEAVVKDATGIRSVAYSTVIPLLTEAIKEQQQQLEQTSADKDRQFEQLKQQNAALAERLKTLEQQVQKMLEAKVPTAAPKP